jgi:hypothetical protein
MYGIGSMNGIQVFFQVVNVTDTNTPKIGGAISVNALSHLD